MHQQHPARAPASLESLDRLLDRFDEAWHRGAAPSIEQFTRFGHDDTQVLIHELIKIDLEYRWRQAHKRQRDKETGRQREKDGDLSPCLHVSLSPRRAASPFADRPRLEDYVARYPRIGALHRLPLSLIIEEYRVRQRWGDQPDHEEYRRRFPRRARVLARALARIDARLRTEYNRTGAVPEPPDTVLAPMRRLGRYELAELLGTGTFGTVWRARDTSLARDVAVKLPRSGQFISLAEEERFLREARSTAQLQHPGIVTVYDVGREEDTVFIVSELVRGVSLAQWLKNTWLDFREAADLVARVADALDYAHHQGVVHRDVKPSNIMLEELANPARPSAGSAPCTASTLTPRLMDFGLALRDSGEVTMTLDGDVLGTPAYMSPEQVSNPHKVDRRSDVYSLGVILYQLLTGELPFRAVPPTLLQQAPPSEPQPPRRVNRRIPRALETICLKCLEKDPARRLPTAAALAAELRRWLVGEPIETRPACRLERTWQWCKRNPALLLTGLLAAAGVVAFAAAPVAVALVALSLASLLLALYKAKAANELARVVSDLRRDRRKTAAALQCALGNHLQARDERDRALVAAAQDKRRHDLVRELARTCLFDLPEKLADPSGPTAARAFLIQNALVYLGNLSRDAGDDDVLLRELAIGFTKVGDMQARLRDAKLARASALASYRKSLDIFAALAQAHPENAQAQRDLARSQSRIRKLERM